MRGTFVFLFGCVGLSVFSVLLLSAENLFLFWLFLEMCVLCLVPLFFLNSGAVGLSALFSYLVVSSVSSSLFVSAVIYEGLVFLAVLGLMVKFGIFPFFGWVYKVVNNSNWFVVWGLSTILKMPFFVFPFLLFGVGSSVLEVCVALSFLFLLGFFWVYTFDWFSCWCHMMLSSSASLVGMSVCQSLSSLAYFFSFYFVWGTLVILFLSYQGDFGFCGALSSYLYVFLLLSLPVSIALFYKFLLACCMFSCGLGIFLMWVFYTASEQFFLLKVFIDTVVPRSGLSVLCFV